MLPSCFKRVKDGRVLDSDGNVAGTFNFDSAVPSITPYLMPNSSSILTRAPIQSAAPSAATATSNSNAPVLPDFTGETTPPSEQQTNDPSSSVPTNPTRTPIQLDALPASSSPSIASDGTISMNPSVPKELSQAIPSQAPIVRETARPINLLPSVRPSFDRAPPIQSPVAIGSASPIQDSKTGKPTYVRPTIETPIALTETRFPTT